MNERDQVLGRALRLLSRRSHSRHQLRQKLLSKADRALVESVLDQLESERYLDDFEYAASRSRYLRTQKRYGSDKIRQDLKSRGIGATIITHVLAEVNQEQEEEFCLEEVVQSWIARHGRPVSVTDMQRLFSHCVRRGFRRSMIRGSLEEYLADLDWSPGNQRRG